MVSVICECCAAFRWCGVASSGEVMNASLGLIVANGGFSCTWDSLARLIVLLRIHQAVVWYERAPFWMSVLLVFSRVESNLSQFTTLHAYTCTILRERKSTINRFCAHYVPPNLIKPKPRATIKEIDMLLLSSPPPFFFPFSFSFFFSCALKRFTNCIKHPLRKKSKTEKAFSVEAQSVWEVSCELLVSRGATNTLRADDTRNAQFLDGKTT